MLRGVVGTYRKLAPRTHSALFVRRYAHTQRKLVLGIETSCDDTAVAIVSSDREIVAEAIASQWDAHKPYGGIDPVMAMREHTKSIDPIVAETMRKSGVRFEDLAAVAVTSGPGLAYCLEVGIKKAKEIVAKYNLPLIGVNHMEGHALTARLTNPEVKFPFLVFLVSGGHTQLTLCKGLGEYMHLGGTLDNPLGSVYDKIARELDLLYAQEGVPGGEAVEKLARQGDPKVYKMEEPMRHRITCDFSFSGILSHMSKLIKTEKEQGRYTEQNKADIAAAFQNTVLALIERNTKRALTWSAAHLGQSVGLVVSGGVARNAALRERLNAVAESAGVRVVYPPARLCTDNGVMIAWAGLERLQAGLVDSPDDVIVRPRWPLDKSGKTHFQSTTRGKPDASIRHKSNYVVSSDP